MTLTPVSPRERADITPARERVFELFQKGDLVPVYRTLLADLETPVSVYLKLSKLGAASCLLESVEGGEQVGRYSFIGVNPRAVLRFKDGDVIRTAGGKTVSEPLAASDDPLHYVRREMSTVQPVKLERLPRLVGGAVGYLSYDVVRYFEKLPATAREDIDVPDAAFMLLDTVVIFDHAKHQLIVMANAHNTGNPESAYRDAVARIDQIVVALGEPLPPIASGGPSMKHTLTTSVTQAEFEENVRRAKDYIAAGDAFQIVLSQRFSRRSSAAPLTIYRALRALNPSPYMFFLRFSDDFTLVGASPEMMVRLEDGIATTRPIAGSRPRGANREEDERLEAELLADPKERAEHVLLIDLGRNDLGRVCDYGTVKVTDMMFIERYSHIMHIVSNVQGKLRAGLNAFDLLRATFPAGTLSGAPKVRAMEIIEELEGSRRGAYGGAVGYFSFDGSMDTCITIRAAYIKDGVVSIQAGAGLVADSDPAREYEESVNKARALAVAVGRAEAGLV
jgi:anthranilate synthase component 1